ncbi:MAG TPA: multidrug effflux MFS transporter, partial [Burkholderiaceae bacterium]|nr:multidrug effflux MFS transporter [Burkholderiaceae bacterium]
MPPSKIHEKFPAWLVLMAALTALGPLAIDMYLPAFPNMAASLNTSQGQVERTLASYLIGLAAAQIVYGPLADRYGRKLTILAGLFVFTLASIGSIFTTNIEHLVIWRVLQALGGAAGMVVPRAVIRDRLETREAAKALSLLMLITGLMPILAPIAGGQLLLLGSWRFIFAFMAIFGVLLLAWVYYGMSETLAPENVRPLKISAITKNYLELLRHRQFMCHTLAGGFGLAGLFAYLTGSPHVFINLYD